MPDSAVTQMTTRQRKADGLMIRYADSEGGEDETVLLVQSLAREPLRVGDDLVASGRDRTIGRHRSAGLRPVRGPG